MVLIEETNSNQRLVPSNENCNFAEVGVAEDDEDYDEMTSQDESSSSAIPQIILRQHYASTAAMCLCSFTHSWLLVSVFPYAGFMVIDLVSGTNEENAGSYAGLLSAAFMIGRALTSYSWGKIADVYGRRIVLFLSLILSVFFSVLFGLSTSFTTALFWRFILGASNGIAGIAKTVVSETAPNETLETRGMALSMGMWGWGFLLGPAISGFLSDPVRQYPHLNLWSNDGRFLYKFFKAYPFMLPNLISVLLCLIDLIVVELWVPETLPIEDLRSPRYLIKDTYNWFRSFAYFGTKFREIDSSEYDTHPLITENENERDDSSIRDIRLAHTESVSLLSTSSPHMALQGTLCNEAGTVANDDTTPQPGKATMASIWLQKDTRNHLLLYWIFSFVAIAIDEAVPLFCISKEGGLGLSEVEIGKLLSATGIIFAISQYHVYAWIVEKYGLRISIQIGALLSAPLVTFVPLSLLLNKQEHHNLSSEVNNGLTWAAFVYLGILLAVCRVFGLVFFSSITVATNRTVIASHRGTMNGLSMLGGSCAKGIGPIFAGLLVSFGISSGYFNPRVGAVFVFALIGFFAAATAAMTFFLLGENDRIVVTSDRSIIPSHEVQDGQHKKEDHTRPN